MTKLPEHHKPLPHLSDEAAVEILDYIETMYQIFETRYASQISRYYRSTDILRSQPPRSRDDEPF